MASEYRKVGVRIQGFDKKASREAWTVYCYDARPSKSRHGLWYVKFDNGDIVQFEDIDIIELKNEKVNDVKVKDVKIKKVDVGAQGETVVSIRSIPAIGTKKYHR